MAMTLIQASVDNAILELMTQQNGMISMEGLQNLMAAQTGESIERLAREGKLRIMRNHVDSETMILTPKR